MICIKSMLQVQKVKWVTRLFLSCSKGWKAICLELLKPLGKELIFFCNIEVLRLQVKVSNWLLDVLKTWAIVTKQNETNIANQILWNNKNILFNGKTIFSQRIAEKGFVKISDILDEHGRPLRWKHCKSNGLQFTEYFTLLDCYKKMPNAWKLFFMQENYYSFIKPINSIPALMIHEREIELHNVTTKQLYNKLLYFNNPGTSKAFDYLREAYGISPEKVRNLFVLPVPCNIKSYNRLYLPKINRKSYNQLYLNNRS